MKTFISAISKKAYHISEKIAALTPQSLKR
jgi:hypothetical protein